MTVPDRIKVSLYRKANTNDLIKKKKNSYARSFHSLRAALFLFLLLTSRLHESHVFQEQDSSGEVGRTCILFDYFKIKSTAAPEASVEKAWIRGCGDAQAEQRGWKARNRHGFGVRGPQFAKGQILSVGCLWAVRVSMRGGVNSGKPEFTVQPS